MARIFTTFINLFRYSTKSPPPNGAPQDLKEVFKTCTIGTKSFRLQHILRIMSYGMRQKYDVRLQTTSITMLLRQKTQTQLQKIRKLNCATFWKVMSVQT